MAESLSTQTDNSAPATGRRRILFVITTSDYGGTETFLKELVSRIDLTRFKPVVCSLCPSGRTAQEIAQTGVEVFSLDMSANPRLPELVRGCRALAKVIDRDSIGVVQALLYRAGFVSALAARFSNQRPAVVSSQRSLTPMGGWPATVGARLTRRWVSQVVAVSQAARDEALRTVRYSPDRVRVISNGVDTKQYQPADALPARRSLGLPEKGLLVGGVGRLAPEKGFDHLLEALSLIRKNGPSARLALVGDGPVEPALREQCRRLGLEDAVHFLGIRTELQQIYPAFDIFALPSLEEGSPMALLEAMACECAPVASRVGGVPDIIEHRRSGLFTEPGSSESIASALESVLTDSDLRSRIGIEARKRVENRFDLDGTVKAYEDLYIENCPAPWYS